MKIEMKGILVGFDFIHPDREHIDLIFTVSKKGDKELINHLRNILRKMETVKIVVTDEIDTEST